MEFGSSYRISSIILIIISFITIGNPEQIHMNDVYILPQSSNMYQQQFQLNYHSHLTTLFETRSDNFTHPLD